MVAGALFGSTDRAKEVNSPKNPGTERTPLCQDQAPFLVLSPTISCKWPWTQSAAEPWRSKSCNAFGWYCCFTSSPT